MIITFDKFFESVEDIKAIDRTNPFNVAACAVNVMNSYKPNDTENFYNMMQYLMGDVQPMSPLMKQQLRDRMTSENKYEYIGKSYFVGATPSNNYEPSMPLQVEVKENPYSYQEEGFARLLLKTSGADSERILTMRKLKDGTYLIWSDTVMGLMAGIRQPESSNPWA